MASRLNGARPQELTADERLAALKDRARELIDYTLSREITPSGHQGARMLLALSDAYHAEWSKHHQDPQILKVVRQALDAAVRRQARHGIGESRIKGLWHYHGIMARCLTRLCEEGSELTIGVPETRSIGQSNGSLPARLPPRAASIMVTRQ